jgi:hypothetical protein
MIKIFDDILDEKETNHIESFLRDPKFSWFLSSGFNHYTNNESTIKNNSNSFSGETLLLGHTFYLNKLRNSDNYLLSDFVLNRFLDRTKISFTELIRSKANLQPSTKENNLLYTTPHIDNFSAHQVLIYYVNDCDGDTFIFEDHTTGKILKQVSPKKGRFVLFDGSLYHSAGFAKTSDFRLNINFNITQ